MSEYSNSIYSISISRSTGKTSRLLFWRTFDRNRKFSGVAELQAQIQRDAAKARELYELANSLVH